MHEKATTRLGLRPIAVASLALALLCSTGVQAAVQYLNDGAKQNAAGKWDLPDKGKCYPVEGAAISTKPECNATIFSGYDSGTCPTAQGSWGTPSLCFDDAGTSAGTCVDTPGVDRVWSGGVCTISMKGYNRNKETCAKLGGRYAAAASAVCTGNWVMQNGTLFTPPLYTSNGANPSTGDQCLRCHRSDTEWNSARVRDVESAVMQGHKNMSRKVTPSDLKPWAGPNGVIYPTDSSGNTIFWNAGNILISGAQTQLYWIYDGWFEEPHLPSAIYAAAPANGKPGVSYSCARCHTTGWTSDATVGPSTGNLAKEPEKTWPGITWDGVTAPVAGQVNLAGGITGDTNKAASWDLFGITCTRCHGSVVDNTTTFPYTTGTTNMSSHHSSLTAPDAGSGYCVDPRIVTPRNPTDAQITATQAACVAAGSQWITPCSDGTTVLRAACLAIAGNTFAQSYCSLPAGYSFPSWQTPQAQGTCDKSFTTAAACIANGGVWTNKWGTDVDSCNDAGGHWTGSRSQRGQIITALCMDCHRQETGGKPYDSGSDPAGILKVGNYHSTATFPSHFHGNQFLNSPHGKFSGTFAEIATGNTANGKYSSHLGYDTEASNTGYGCTACHDVHKSTNASANPKGGAVKECTECHAGNYAKPLDLIRHPSGPGTPFANADKEPASPCISCHMPGGQHLFRINASASYSPYPDATYDLPDRGVTDALTSPDGTYTKAVWIDMNAACGQCHGGGKNHALTSGSMAAGALTITVANPANFARGEAIRIGGAASLAGKPADLNTVVVSVAGNVVTLMGKSTYAVTDAVVELNATQDKVTPYLTKDQLAAYAKGIHMDGNSGGSDRNNYQVTFTATQDPAEAVNLTVDTLASVNCGTPCPTLTYGWFWNDGTDDTFTTPDASHVFAAGPQTIKLVVYENGVASGSATRSITVFQPNRAPQVGETNVLTGMTLKVTDTSTDADNNLTTVKVDWGDGSFAVGNPKALFAHTYLAPSINGYTVTFTATDAFSLSSTTTFTVNPQAPATRRAAR